MELLSLALEENESGGLGRLICHLKYVEGALEGRDREPREGPAGKLFLWPRNESMKAQRPG